MKVLTDYWTIGIYGHHLLSARTVSMTKKRHALLRVVLNSLIIVCIVGLDMKDPGPLATGFMIWIIIISLGMNIFLALMDVSDKRYDENEKDED